jgi:hypothetical protein
MEQHTARLVIATDWPQLGFVLGVTGREAKMGRRYYGLKALIVVLGIAMAVVSSYFGAPKLENSTARIHYGAAASVQSAMTETTLEVTHAVKGFILRNACIVHF